MDKSASLHYCRQLLRRINCEAVIDTSDQNLYDILICSEEKKTALLSWLVQNLFTPDECANSSFEDLLSMFMTSAELTSFLNGTMSIKSQYNMWKLIMTTVYQKKEQPGTNHQDTLHLVLSGKLLDELIDSWNRKVEKPSASLLPRISNSKRIADLQNQISTLQEQLKQLDSLPELNSEISAEPRDVEIEGRHLVSKFLDEYRTLQELSVDSESQTDDNFVQKVHKNSTLANIEQNLLQLQDIMKDHVSMNLKC